MVRGDLEYGYEGGDEYENKGEGGRLIDIEDEEEKTFIELENNTARLIEQTDKALQVLRKKEKQLQEKEKSHKMQLRPDPKRTQPFPMYPLIESSGRQRYRPFGIGDVQAIVDKLPPVAEGGNLWLSKLESLTAGQLLALGDFRAVISRCLTDSDVRDIQISAGILGRVDEESFLRHQEQIGKVMRQKYPLPNASVMPKMKWDPKQNPRTYIEQCKETWLRHTGYHPGNEGSQREWFRQAILDGVPGEVSNNMKNNPDMLGSDSSVWEKHLIHHLTRAQDTCEKEQDNLKALQTQLLKLQLTEARQKTHKKEKGETARVMMAEQTGTPDLYPTPPWVPSHQRQGGYGGGPMRVRGGWRGRTGRGGPSRGQPGGGRCYFCNETGHWARDCPQLGRGGSDSRGRGRPSLPHNRGQGQRPVPPVPHQMPQWDTWDEWGTYQQQ